MAGPGRPDGQIPQVIQGYGAGRFRIAGVVHERAVLVLPDRTIAWDVSRFEEAGAANLSAVMEAEPSVDILLLGCGPAMRPVPAELRAAMRAAGIAVEPMDTGAACRTFNLLAAEERRVAAALIPVG